MKIINSNRIEFVTFPNIYEEKESFESSLKKIISSLPECVTTDFMKMVSGERLPEIKL